MSRTWVRVVSKTCGVMGSGTDGVMGCVWDRWGHGLCVGRMGSWVVSKTDGVMTCV